MRLDHEQIRRSLIALVDAGCMPALMGGAELHELLEFFAQLKYIDEKRHPTAVAHLVADVVRDDRSWNVIENARLMAKVTGMPWSMRVQSVENVTSMRINHTLEAVLEGQAKNQLAIPMIDPRSNGFRGKP